MKIRSFAALFFIISLFFGLSMIVNGQSRPQRPDTKSGDGKKNKRPSAPKSWKNNVWKPKPKKNARKMKPMPSLTPKN